MSSRRRLTGFRFMPSFLGTQCRSRREVGSAGDFGPRSRPLEALEQRTLLSASPQVVITQATTLDSKSVSVSYTISNSSATQPLTFDFYRSAQPAVNAGSTLIGEQTLPSTDSADLSTGSHRVAMIEGTSLTPNTAKQYIVVVADANGSLVEASGSVNTAYFQTLMLAALSHGMELTGSSVPSWESTMATDLVSDDGYNYAIPFNWVTASRQAKPGLAVAAGNQLYAQVISEADSLATAHLGDVVDLHFIGHSRGAVVISQAMQDLVGTTDPALQGSYIKATFLDPHPAGPSTLSLYSSSSSLLGKLAVAAYKVFELAANDPQVVIPSNVQDVEVDYQHTSAADFGLLNDESTLNLWGEGPSDGIINNSGAMIVWTNLTSPPGNVTNPIGHSEVPTWYLTNVVVPGDASLVT